MKSYAIHVLPLFVRFSCLFCSCPGSPNGPKGPNSISQITFPAGWSCSTVGAPEGLRALVSCILRRVVNHQGQDWMRSGYGVLSLLVCFVHAVGGLGGSQRAPRQIHEVQTMLFVVSGLRGSCGIDFCLRQTV